MGQGSAGKPAPAMNTLPRPAQAFVLLVCCLGIAAAAASPLLPRPAEVDTPWETGLFIALGLLAGRTKVRLMPRGAAEDLGSLSLSFALIFAALLRLGPGAAMLVGGFSTLSSCLHPRRQPPHQIAFNLGLSAFATFVAGQAFLESNGGLEPRTPSSRCSSPSWPPACCSFCSTRSRSLR